MNARCEADKLNLLVKNYLKTNGIYNEDASWTVKESPLGGYGIFTTRDLKSNDLIYKDVPVIIGPRAALQSPPVCVNCYENKSLSACSKGCGLPLCSLNCENSTTHKQECTLIRKWQNKNCNEINLKMLKSLTPIRSLFLNDTNKNLVLNLLSHYGPNHGFEVQILKNELHFEISEEDEAFMVFVCTVLDANAFEVIVGNETNQSSLRGLYPLASLANHQCVPNTMHVFDDEQRMIVKATVDIPAGNEIFHSYSCLIWGNIARRYHLIRTKHFWCSCLRCMDRTEFGTNMCSVYCPKCKGLVLPINPLKINTQWECDNCKSIFQNTKINMITSILSTRVASFTDEDVEELVMFLKEKLLQMVPETNQISIELKYRLVWILGYKQGYSWTEISDEHLILKKEICRDLLGILNKLNAGLCKMRGLLLYELSCCLKEIQRRDGKKTDSNNNTIQNEISNLLKESAVILKEDVSIPSELKAINEEINNNII